MWDNKLNVLHRKESGTDRMMDWMNTKLEISLVWEAFAFESKGTTGQTVGVHAIVANGQMFFSIYVTMFVSHFADDLFGCV